MSSDSDNIKKITAPVKSKNKSKPFNKNLKMYHIVWRDAFSEMDEWHSKETIEEDDYICETIGYLIETTKKPNYYTVASTITVDGYFCCVINIPKSMVLSKKRITII